MLSLERRGSGVPLVFLHAFPLHRGMWSAQVEVFARNFQVITIDFPGFGQSPISTSPQLSLSDVADQVLQTLDANGVNERFILAGLSLGGYLSFQVFKKAAERIRALALVTTKATPDTDEVRAKRFENIALVKKEGTVVLAKRLIPGLFGKTAVEQNYPVVSVAREMIEKANPEGVCGALFAMAGRPDSSALLSAIKVPTLVLAGAEDTIIPSPVMEEMAQKIPQHEFHRVEKSGHLLSLEQPLVFNDLFLHFLKRRVL